MKRPEPERHTLYFEVLDAVREAKGCPLCHLEADRMRRYLDGILYEFVNDSGVRAELARSKGFCHTHAHMLLGVEGPRALGIAILYRDQVHQFLKFLQGLKEPTSDHFWRQKRSTVWEASEPCPACRLQAEQRLRYSEVVVGSLNEPEFRNAFEASAGLCVSHFLSALDLIQDFSVRDLLIAIQEAKLADLKHDLEEFCRKNDYRFRDEGFGKEGDSWLRAVRLMVGDG
jgi:hypothetical protein